MSSNCEHCDRDRAVGFVRTESPTKVAHRDFRLCMPDIIDLERWIQNKPNAKGEMPYLIFLPKGMTLDKIAAITVHEKNE